MVSEKKELNNVVYSLLAKRHSLLPTCLVQLVVNQIKSPPPCSTHHFLLWPFVISMSSLCIATVAGFTDICVGVAVEIATDQMADVKLADKATNGATAVKPPLATSQSPSTAPDEGKDDEEGDNEDEIADQQREAELQQLNEELAKEDPR